MTVSGLSQGLFGSSSGASFYADSMARGTAVFIRSVARRAKTMVVTVSPRLALIACAIVFAVLVWVITIAPIVVVLALTAAVAIAWCVWLDKHPEPRHSLECSSQSSEPGDPS
jgi:hypothetical protein